MSSDQTAAWPGRRLRGSSRVPGPLGILVALLFVGAGVAVAQPPPDPPGLPGSDPFGDPFGDRFGQREDLDALIRSAFFGRSPAVRNRALRFLVERDQKDVIPAFIAVLRVVRDEDGQIVDALERLARARLGRDWKAWLEWQEEHTEVRPYRGFVKFKADILAGIDPAFRDFLHPGVRHDVRIEEIVWGGVKKDGIPALVNATQIPAAEADYLTDAELVFGVSVNGDARAYPLRILDWHEMFNDVVGGVPVSLAYCTLCGSGILFDTRVPGRREPFVFGSSGLLYRSNKLMYDTETESLWNQFTGEPVVGELTGSGIELKMLPVVISSWADWLAAHPETTVLSLDTGFTRDYRPGQPYGYYFQSPDLMFPVVVRDRRLDPKDRVFVLREGEHEMAWALSLFGDGAVIHDRVGDLDAVLIGNGSTETVRAYESGSRRFALDPGDPGSVTSDDERWRITEDALIGPDGEQLPRLTGHVAYWFAWASYKQNRPLRVE